MTEHWLGSDVPLHAQHERSVGAGLHICAIVQRGSDSRGEHVEIVNDGAAPVPLTGLELTACSGLQHKHVYSFPPGPGDSALELAAGRTAYVFSGTGRSERTPSGDRILFAGLPAPVWNDTSHVAHLRRPQGRIIDTMHVGRPPRHPDGHAPHSGGSRQLP
ncbi:MAG: lamin tail domain-containing protein [Actinobacteria bacterium]|nr:lamin tail domain-containing protein [Actinomycetota bacterium]